MRALRAPYNDRCRPFLLKSVFYGADAPPNSNGARNCVATRRTGFRLFSKRNRFGKMSRHGELATCLRVRFDHCRACFGLTARKTHDFVILRPIFTHRGKNDKHFIHNDAKNGEKFRGLSSLWSLELPLLSRKKTGRRVPRASAFFSFGGGANTSQAPRVLTFSRTDCVLKKVENQCAELLRNSARR